MKKKVSSYVANKIKELSFEYGISEKQIYIYYKRLLCYKNLSTYEDERIMEVLERIVSERSSIKEHEESLSQTVYKGPTMSYSLEETFTRAINEYFENDSITLK